MPSVPTDRFWLSIALILGATGLSAQTTEHDPRRAMVEQILTISEQVIPNPAWLESEAWQSFSSELRSPAMLALDEEDFARTFNQAAADLPFTHYRLERRRNEPSPGDDHQSPTGLALTKAEHGTAILRIDHLAMPGEVMTAMVEQLRAGDYRHLVLDFRTTPGGSFPAGIALGRFLSDQPVDTGVYLTRHWFMRHGGYPGPDTIAKIAPLETLNLEAFARQLQQHGVLRIVVPGHKEPIFEGQLYVLTSRNTASAAEPFVERVGRHPERVTVIGETTAGAMLSGEHFPLNEHWQLFAPVADYMTSEGKRLDGVGVRPHIEISADRALEKALSLIEERSLKP